MLGGSAAMNAMMVLRGHRADYDGWAASGCTGWSWADVEPAFARSAQGAFPLNTLPEQHVLAEAFVHAAQAAGIPASADLNGEDNEGVGFVPVSQRRGRRFSVLEGYVASARRRPNLTIATDALVTRIALEDGRAVGVAYRLDGDELDEEARCTREVVVCAGAIGTPHLLQLSGVGPREPLEAAGVEVLHEAAGVGSHLLDHLANGLLVRTKGVETLASAESLRNLALWALRGRGALTSNLGEAVAFVRSRTGLRAPDLELLLAPVLFQDEGLTQPTEHGLTLAVVLLEPRSSGTVLLRSSDPRVSPAIDPRYLTDPGGEDEATLLRGLRLARSVLAEEPLAGFVEGEMLPGDDVRTDDGLRAHIRALSQTLYHPAGTCRMGSDPDAVVDPQLRVNGLAGLRVADASVMPKLPRGHTNWPTVMIAERAAELVAAALR
jgi:choline dehydrogenase